MSQRTSMQAEMLRQRLGLSYDHLIAIRFSINVVIATIVVWATLKLINDTNPIWAIASMVAASDPVPAEARRMFKARMINVLVGCAVGLAFVVIAGASDWLLPLALGTTVLISSLVIRVKTMWRQAPITAAVVIAAGISHASRSVALIQGLHKVAEVIFGCLVGLVVSWLMSKVWLIKIEDKQKPKS